MQDLLVERLRVLEALVFAEGLAMIGADEERPPLAEPEREEPQHAADRGIGEGDLGQVTFVVGPLPAKIVRLVGVHQVRVEKERPRPGVL